MLGKVNRRIRVCLLVRNNYPRTWFLFIGSFAFAQDLPKRPNGANSRGRDELEQGSQTKADKRAWFYRYPRGFPLLLFVIVCLGTALTVVTIERSDQERRRIELESNAAEVAFALERRATEDVALLRAGAAFFETQPEVTAEKFSDFLEGIHFDSHRYGALGMGWVPLVSADRLTYFEVALRKREEGDFLVFPRPEAGRQFAAPVVYLLPETPANRMSVGFDMYSEPVRRDAMQRAIISGSAATSAPIELIQDRGRPDREGFTIYMPVATSPGGDKIKGFVYTPLRADEFLGSATELLKDKDVEIALYDQVKVHENLLAKRSLPGRTGLSTEMPIEVADRRWILQVSNKLPGSLTPLSRLTLFFGAIAALLVLAIGQLITSRAIEDRKVLERLSSEAAIRNSLVRELNHRVKNTLANVLSIAALTRRRSTDIDDFNESLIARIRALSATHDILSQSEWTNAPLREVVRSELAPYMEGDGSRVDLSGPEILLAPNDAMSLGLAIHELATNAAKYGAFSREEGKTFVTWEWISPDRIELRWRETGGPPVVEPTQNGFGRDLIEKIVSHELGTDVQLEFKPEGVECTLHVPVRPTREFALRAQRKTST